MSEGLLSALVETQREIGANVLLRSLNLLVDGHRFCSLEECLSNIYIRLSRPWPKFWAVRSSGVLLTPQIVQETALAMFLVSLFSRHHDKIGFAFPAVA